MPGRVEVHGLAELQRALRGVDKDVAKNIRDELKNAALPVQVDAANLAQREIRNIGPAWSRMRIGATTGSVYVAPARRSRGGSKRPNLGGLLMDRALQPALDKNEDKIEKRVEQMIDNIADFHGF